MICPAILNMCMLILCNNFGMLFLRVYSSNIYACFHLDIFPVKYIVGSLLEIACFPRVWIPRERMKNGRDQVSLGSLVGNGS